MNKLFLHGNLTKDPDIRRNQKGTKIANITVAVKRGYGENQSTEFIPLVAFNKTAELLEKYFTKGSEIITEAEVANNDYEDSNGVKHYTFRFYITGIEFAGSKKQKAAQTEQTDPLEGFDEIEDISLPF